MKELKRCTRCLLPETHESITFDDEGLCNICQQNHFKNNSINWLNKKGISNDQIILYGESLGTGIALEVAQNKNFAGIILESPFTSMIDVGKSKYPFLPVRLLLKDKYESNKKIKNIQSPILIMHGKKDNIVPQKMGLELYEKANQPKFSYFPENDDHMMEYNDNLLNSIKLFINKI